MSWSSGTITKGAKLMNGSIVWPILVFVVGVTVGVVVGVKVVGSDYKKRIDQLLDDNDFLNDQIMNLTDPENPMIVRTAMDEKDIGTMLDLTRRYHVDSTTSEHPRHDRDAVGEDMADGPYEITEEEYDANLTTVNSESLIYYTLDRVLTDSDDDPIKNPIALIGAPTFEYLGIVTMNVERVFVHSDVSNTNYEIVIEHGLGYRRDVLGAIDDDEITDFEDDYAEDGPDDDDYEDESEEIV